MKKKISLNTVLIFLLSIACFFGMASSVLFDGGRITQYVITSAIYFLIPALVFRTNKNKRIKILKIFIIPLLFFLFVVLYSSYVQQTFFVLPVSLIGLISLFASYYFSLLKDKRFMIFLVYIFIFIISFYIYLNYLFGSTVSQDKINYPFPDVTIYNENSTNFNITSKRNKIIVFDLWSTSCGICFKKFPEFEKQYLRYKNDPEVELYTLYLPLKRDTSIVIKDLLKKYKFPKLYAQGLDSWKKLDNKSVPKIIMIDKKGNIRFKGAMNTNKYLFYNNFNSLIENLKNE